jgi:hypothetical protein
MVINVPEANADKEPVAIGMIVISLLWFKEYCDGMVVECDETV